MMVSVTYVSHADEHCRGRSGAYNDGGTVSSSLHDMIHCVGYRGRAAHSLPLQSCHAGMDLRVTPSQAMSAKVSDSESGGRRVHQIIII